MNRSDYFKYRIKKKKEFAILFEIAFLMIILKLIPAKTDSTTKTIVLVLLIFVIIVSIICTVNFILKVNNYNKEELDKICDELDNHVDKDFPKFGLYFTKNYLICIGNYNPFKLFAVELDKIEMVNTFYYMSHAFYKSEKKRDLKRKGKKESLLIDFFRYTLKKKIYHPNSSDDSFRVFDLICDDGVYRITNIRSWNRKKEKYVEEVVDYISKRLPNIEYR